MRLGLAIKGKNKKSPQPKASYPQSLIKHWDPPPPPHPRVSAYLGWRAEPGAPEVLWRGLKRGVGSLSREISPSCIQPYKRLGGWLEPVKSAFSTPQQLACLPNTLHTPRHFLLGFSSYSSFFSSSLAGSCLLLQWRVHMKGLCVLCVCMGACMSDWIRVYMWLMCVTL